MTDLVDALRRHAMITEEVGCGSDQGRKIAPVTMREAAGEIERLRTALLRIKSLDPKNVPKYAQQIAAEALAAVPVGSHADRSPVEKTEGGA